MSDATTPELARIADELAETQRALARLADTVGNSHFATRQDHARIEHAIERATDTVNENAKQLAVVLERISSTSREGGPAKGAPPPTDPQIEIGPVKLPESTWRKALPIAGYVLLGAALAVVGAAVAGAWLFAQHGP